MPADQPDASLEDLPPIPFDAPDGFHFEWRPDDDWFVGTRSSGRCRFAVGRRACGAPAVASLRRGTTHTQWWDYCGEHLYGRRLVDGVVMQWVMRPDVETPVQQDFSRPVEITLTTTVYLTAEQWEAVKAAAVEYQCSDEEAFFEVMNRAVAEAIEDADDMSADFMFEDDGTDEDEPGDDDE